MYNYLYKIYPKLFKDDYKVLYMDTDSIYAKLNMTHEKYIELLQKNKIYLEKKLVKLNRNGYIILFKRVFFYLQKVKAIFVKMI